MAHQTPSLLYFSFLFQTKPLAGNKKETLRTRQVAYNGTTYCLHWKLWQVLKQPGLRLPVDNETGISSEGRSVVRENKVACTGQIKNNESHVCIADVQTKNINAADINRADAEAKTFFIEGEVDEDESLEDAKLSEVIGSTCNKSVVDKEIADTEQGKCEDDGDSDCILGSLEKTNHIENVVLDKNCFSMIGETNKVIDNTVDKETIDEIRKIDADIQSGIDNLGTQLEVCFEGDDVNLGLVQEKLTGDIVVGEGFAGTCTLKGSNCHDDVGKPALVTAQGATFHEQCLVHKEAQGKYHEIYQNVHKTVNKETLESLKKECKIESIKNETDEESQKETTIDEDESTIVLSHWQDTDFKYDWRDNIPETDEKRCNKMMTLQSQVDIINDNQVSEQDFITEIETDKTEIIPNTETKGNDNVLTVQSQDYIDDDKLELINGQDIMHVDTDKVDTISKPEIDLNDETVKLQSNFNTNEDNLVILHGQVVSVDFETHKADSVPRSVIETVCAYPAEWETNSFPSGNSTGECIVNFDMPDDSSHTFVNELHINCKLVPDVVNLKNSSHLSNIDEFPSHIRDDLFKGEDKIKCDVECERNAKDDVLSNDNIQCESIFVNTCAITEHDTQKVNDVSSFQPEHCLGVHISEDIEHRSLYKFYGCFTPYGAKCRPHIYGFRGPLHVWNEKEGKFTFVYNDRVTAENSRTRHIPIEEDNIHQAYFPKTSCKHYLI